MSETPGTETVPGTYCVWCCIEAEHKADGACVNCRGYAADARALCDAHRVEGEAMRRAGDGWGGAILATEERKVLDPKDPYTTAREFVQSQKNLLHHAGSFYRWDPIANYYPALEEKVVRSDAWAFLSDAKKEVTVKAKTKGEDDRTVEMPFTPSAHNVNEVMDAAGAQVVYPKTNVPPCWLDGRASPPLVAFKNGLLDIASRKLIPPDPRFYTHTSLPFNYDPAVGADPPEWLKFLHSLWPDTEVDESEVGDRVVVSRVGGEGNGGVKKVLVQAGEIGLLQEVFGYIVSGDTRMQKIFMMVGPKRSGKGTIGRVFRQLLGQRNVAGPTLESLGDVFGRECLIGKSMALIADARLSANAKVASVVEELLAISGEDPRSIQRKYLPSYDAPIPIRFMLLTNELPKLEDASGALSSRFVILQMTLSFYGREDLGLQSRLEKENSEILNWALDGWDRLRKRGYFVQPESSREIIKEFEEMGSPISTFLEDRCLVGPSYEVDRPVAWEEWQQWCKEQGRDFPGVLATFGRNLRAALPQIRDAQRTMPDGKKVRTWRGFGIKAATAPGARNRF